jgi:hypothetical protein
MSSQPKGTPSTAEELAKIPYEPLMDVEKKLIVYSLVLGVILLVVLVWISYTFFTVPK